jgi:2-oxoglutarate dehydrogenase E2 component (dihydrolipoamide succinyltransferase)
MPQLGESVVEGTVGKWLVREGQAVKQYDVLLEVITDKVDTEVTAPAAGTVLRILVGEGETVRAGTPIAVLGEAGEAVQAPEMPAAEAPAVGSPVAPPSGARLSPIVARMAAEHQIDVRQVQGTGLGGRVTKKDVLAHLEKGAPAPAAEPELMPWETPGSGDLFKPASPWQAPAPAPAPAAVAAAPLPPAAPVVASQTADETLVPLSSMRRTIARHMVASKFSAPHVTTVFEVDMSRVMAHRDAHKAEFASQGLKLTLTPYLVEAVVAALKAYPQLNASFSDEGIVMKKRIHIGIAVDIGEGLLVPVVRDADELNLKGLARTITSLAERARARQLKADELTGSTFTITNHGVSGSLFATPIINQPNVGILGVGTVQKRVVVINDAIAIRPMCYLSLTFDHRALDGATADRFMGVVVGGLGVGSRE